ncbi:hypothetical protein V1478_002726 [Vespula squamosa]|uniref:Uncharacterized protein n=1 Tax=Vespula squamosa TaxID=30214 RepID=A0ABD2BSG1_VESSQ
MVNLTLTSLWDNPFMHITVPKVALVQDYVSSETTSIHITKSIIAVTTRESKSRINDPSKARGDTVWKRAASMRKRSVRIGFATIRQAGTANTESWCNEIADAIGQRAKIGWRWVSVVEHRGYCPMKR